MMANPWTIRVEQTQCGRLHTIWRDGHPVADVHGPQGTTSKAAVWARALAVTPYRAVKAEIASAKRDVALCRNSVKLAGGDGCDDVADEALAYAEHHLASLLRIMAAIGGTEAP